MKNQYFGDIHDFEKYAILRYLTGLTYNQNPNEKFSLAFIWMLTPPSFGDGNKRNYLAADYPILNQDEWLHNKLRAHFTEHPDDFTALAQALKGRNVEYVNELFPDIKTNSHTTFMNNKYFSQDLYNSINEDIVFIDPDNGFYPPLRPNVNKHLSPTNLEGFYSDERIICVYQHRPQDTGWNAYFSHIKASIDSAMLQDVKIYAIRVNRAPIGETRMITIIPKEPKGNAELISNKIIKIKRNTKGNLLLENLNKYRSHIQANPGQFIFPL